MLHDMIRVRIPARAPSSFSSGEQDKLSGRMSTRNSLQTVFQSLAFLQVLQSVRCVLPIAFSIMDGFIVVHYVLIGRFGARWNEHRSIIIPYVSMFALEGDLPIHQPQS